MSKVSTKSKKELDGEMEDDVEEGGNTRVNIDNTYYFRMDTMSYILCKEQIGKSKDGDEIKREVVIGYYPSIEGIFKRYFKEQVNLKIRNKTMSLLDFKNVILEVNKSIKQIADSLSFDGSVK